jgi:hypothetical protein
MIATRKGHGAERVTGILVRIQNVMNLSTVAYIRLDRSVVRYEITGAFGDGFSRPIAIFIALPE